MRVLVTGVVVVVALVVGVAALAVLNLRALIGAHHDRLVARVASMVGRPIEVGAIVPSWWPLGVRLHDVTIGEDAAFGTEPFLRAEGVVMGVRPWPLIHGRIEATGVTLDRPRLNLVRDRSARWNVESLGLAPDDGGNGKSKSRESRFAVRVPLEWVVGLALTEMRDGDVTIEDRRAEPPMHFVLRHVRVHAEDVRFGATARVRVDAALFAADAPDTRLDLQVTALGQNDVEHAPFTARLETADADLGQLGGWLGRARVGSGRVRRLTIDAGRDARARARDGRGGRRRSRAARRHGAGRPDAADRPASHAREHPRVRHDRGPPCDQRHAHGHRARRGDARPAEGVARRRVGSEGSRRSRSTTRPSRSGRSRVTSRSSATARTRRPSTCSWTTSRSR